MSITIVQGDLLKQPVDAIVNPANLFLRHGAGLARKIADAATYLPNVTVDDEWLAQSRKVRQWEDEQRVPTIPTGGVHVTSAGVLPFKGVIHAVGPVWGGGKFLEEDLLEIVHENICDATQDRGWKSIAIPAISCGLFRFPVEKAAPIAVAVATWDWDLDITFALFEDEHFYAYADAALNADVDFELRAECDEVARLQELARS